MGHDTAFYTLSPGPKPRENQTARNVPVQFFVKTVGDSTDTSNLNVSVAAILKELQNATPIGDLQILPKFYRVAKLPSVFLGNHRRVSISSPST